jgi:hypothetical protein
VYWSIWYQYNCTVVFSPKPKTYEHRDYYTVEYCSTGVQVELRNYSYLPTSEKLPLILDDAHWTPNLANILTTFEGFMVQIRKCSILFLIKLSRENEQLQKIMLNFYGFVIL